MYKLKTYNRRIDWIYETYCNTNKYSIQEFIILINKYYYKHSSPLYKYRYIQDIENQYSKLFKELNLDQKNQLNIINIGAGQGFDFFQFKNNNINFNKYYFIEPDSNMIDFFKKNKEVRDEKLVIINGLFTESIVKEIQSISNKIIIMNSCLHHFTEIEDFINLIKKSLRKGDMFILCHEPNNNYTKSILSYLSFFE